MTQEIIGNIEVLGSNFRSKTRPCSRLLSEDFEAFVRCHHKQMNRQRVFFENPQQDCCVQKSRNRINTRDDNHLASSAGGKVLRPWRTDNSPLAFLTHLSNEAVLHGIIAPWMRDV